MENKQQILNAIPPKAKVLISYIQKRLDLSLDDLKSESSVLIDEGYVEVIKTPQCSECHRKLESFESDNCLYCGADSEEEAEIVESIYYSKVIK